MIKWSLYILGSSLRYHIHGSYGLCILTVTHISAFTFFLQPLPNSCFINVSSSDFLSNLLVLLIRIMNAGLSDSGLLAHLSEATAGTLSGIGHSTAYEEPATYE